MSACVSIIYGYVKKADCMWWESNSTWRFHQQLFRI